ncbi:MAG TPA: beta-N-acetylhexosaminidase [Planosporangium sp.]|nr:beta-N-acetylhexosaminidase [Planosporangium sp.]
MLIPKPVGTTPADGVFVLDRHTIIAAGPEMAGVAGWLRGCLAPATGYPLPAGSGGPGAIRVELVDELDGDEYRLRVRPDGVRITAGGRAGGFYAAQTLRQLLPPEVYRAAATGRPEWTIRAVDIADRPRFRWRGCLLDVARHFMPKPALLRFIDLLAMHKLNVLHLHLTDDQGWRLEIRRYPKLTEVGSWRRQSPVGHPLHERSDRRPHGGYYTQDDIREIVAYAADRHVTVVPEIDLPGHSQAAIAAYPELGNLDQRLKVSVRWGVGANILNPEEYTLDFYRAVFDEVLELFPGRYVCIGGDEVPKAQWENSARVQQRIRDLGRRDEYELQSWFVHQFAEYLAARGRRLLGWDEIIEGGLAPGATVLSWRGAAGGVIAARRGHDAVMCPYPSVYLDYRQSEHPGEPIPVGTVTTLSDVYAYEPLPAGLTDDEATRVLGAQCCVWTEYMDSPRVVDYMAFPRLCAFAETVWSAADRDFADFQERLATHERRLDALGVEYRHADGPRPWQSRPDAEGWPVPREQSEAYQAEVAAELASHADGVSSGVALGGVDPGVAGGVGSGVAGGVGSEPAPVTERPA